MSTAASPPAWFTHAIQTPAISRTVQVRGASIHYRVWNPEARRGESVGMVEGLRNGVLDGR